MRGKGERLEQQRSTVESLRENMQGSTRKVWEFGERFGAPCRYIYATLDAISMLFGRSKRPCM